MSWKIYFRTYLVLLAINIMAIGGERMLGMDFSQVFISRSWTAVSNFLEAYLIASGFMQNLKDWIVQKIKTYIYPFLPPQVSKGIPYAIVGAIMYLLNLSFVRLYIIPVANHSLENDIPHIGIDQVILNVVITFLFMFLFGCLGEWLIQSIVQRLRIKKSKSVVGLLW